MRTAVRTDSHILAGWVAAPFILLSLVDGIWKIPLSSSGPIINLWIYDLIKWVLVPVALLITLHRLAFVQAREYGLSADLGKRDIIYVLPIPLIILFLTHFITGGVADHVLGYPRPPFDHSNMLGALGRLWIAGTIYLSATAGLWESVFLIGLPWLWFSRGRTVSARATSAFALVISLIFAAGHLENGMPNAIGAFFFQLVAVYWYLRLGTLWPIIGAHFLIDVVYLWPAAKI